MKHTPFALGIAALITILHGTSPAVAAAGVASPAPMPPPSPPLVLKEAVDACTHGKAGDRCSMQVEARDEHGVCVAFGGEAARLVCAMDAPP